MSINEDDLFDMELFDTLDSGGGGGCLTKILIAVGIIILIGYFFS